MLYRWRIKPDLETRLSKRVGNSRLYSLNEHWRGSRLHRGTDGIFYSYAQWESDEHRQKAFENRPDLPAAAEMRSAIEESFPEVVLEIVSDFLIFQEKK